MERKDTLRLLVLLMFFLLCGLCYYAGEVAAACGFERVPDFFYGVHDIHRILFMLPIFYAAYYFGSRAVLIMTILSISAFVPRALFISPFPDPLARVLVFGLVAGFLGYVVARLRTRVFVLNQKNVRLLKEREILVGRLAREEGKHSGDETEGWNSPD